MTWPLVPLGAIISRLEAGVSVNASGEPVLNDQDIGVLKVSCVSQGRFIPSENKRVVPEDVSRVATSPRAGDIVISRANTSDLVGACGIVKEDQPNLFLSDKLWRVVLSDPKTDSSAWLIALLNSNQLRREFHRRATGTSGSMKNIAKEALLAIVVPRPPSEMQVRLGGMFRSIEAASAGIGRLVAAKQHFKRGLMQHLLTGRRRFPRFALSKETQPGEFGVVPADWEVVRIGDVAREHTVRGAVSGAIVYSCTKHKGLVPSLEYFGKQIFSRDLAAYKYLEVGDFAYATNHIDEGSIGLLRKGKTNGLVSPMYTVFRAGDRVVPEFLFALLKTESYRRLFEKRTTASVNRRGSLRWPQFAEIRVPLPTREEQLLIVETQDLCDREIELLESLRKQLDRQKGALLSRVLSGDLGRSEVRS